MFYIRNWSRQTTAPSSVLVLQHYTEYFFTFVLLTMMCSLALSFSASVTLAKSKDFNWGNMHMMLDLRRKILKPLKNSQKRNNENWGAILQRSLKKGPFFRMWDSFFKSPNLPNKLSQKTILSLKFKFPANNNESHFMKKATFSRT